MIKETDFFRELDECLTSETDIRCHVSSGITSKTEITLQGPQPCLFSAVCEIVKAVAMKEPADIRRKFVELVRDIVLLELSEEE